LRSIVSRVVSAALNEALSPFWEAVFLPCSFGFRKDLSCGHLLLALEDAVVNRGLTVVGQDDIYHAFDEVQIDDVLRVHRSLTTDPQLLAVIESTLRGPQGLSQGILQGDSYSPTALNVLLHSCLDIPSSTGATSPLSFRYADNLVDVGASVPEVNAIADLTRTRLTKIGLRLKGTDGPPVDLMEPNSQVRILGLVLKLDANQLRYGLDGEAWNGLDRRLTEAHRTNNPPETAAMAVKGWIGAIAPTLERMSEESIAERILGVAVKAGFREVPGEQIRRWLQSSTDSWAAFRRRDQVAVLRGKVSSSASAPSGSHGPYRDVSTRVEIPEAGSIDTVSVDAGNFSCQLPN